MFTDCGLNGLWMYRDRTGNQCSVNWKWPWTLLSEMASELNMQEKENCILLVIAFLCKLQASSDAKSGIFQIVITSLISCKHSFQMDGNGISFVWLSCSRSHFQSSISFHSWDLIFRAAFQSPWWKFSLLEQLLSLLPRWGQC